MKMYGMERKNKMVGGMMETSIKPKRKQASMGTRLGYRKGGSTQPEYKAGEMHQCKPL